MLDRPSGFLDAMFVRQFRLWCMAREQGEAPLPIMHKEALQQNFQDQTAAACSSLFELVEAHLGRQLKRECCCSQTFSADESALIGILREAPRLARLNKTHELPSSLPRAISLAAASVCDAMGHAPIAALTQLNAMAARNRPISLGSSGQTNGI